MKTAKLYGPPGTGKTHALIHRLQRELETVAPNRIAFVTFTRTACEEITQRIGRESAELPFVKTIHATCLHQLNLSHEQLVGRRLQHFAKAVGVELTNGGATFALDGLQATGERQTLGDHLLQLDHLARHRGCQLSDVLRESQLSVSQHYADWFITEYHTWKRTQRLYDFTDLLTEYLETGEPLPIDVLFVDEGQDLSWLQWQVVRKFSGDECRRRYLAGDDDQTIFTWAGASAQLFNDVDGDTFVLPHSYRLPRRVFDLALDVVQRVRRRIPKTFTPRDSLGELQSVGALDSDLLRDDTLVLYRNYHRGRALADQLEQLGVAFTGANAVLDEDSVQLVLHAWGRLLDNDDLLPRQVRALMRYADTRALFREGFKFDPKRKANTAVSELIRHDAQLTADNWAVYLHKLPKLDYLQRAAAFGDGLVTLLKPHVMLRSIHASKGREAHTVIIDPEMARKTYDAYMRAPDDEHRVWYVAVTRARERLYLLAPESALVYPL